MSGRRSKLDSISKEERQEITQRLYGAQKGLCNEALQELVGEHREVGSRIENNQIRISWTNPDGSPTTETHELLEEPGQPPARSFLARIPFSCLYHDREINPRSIVDLEPMIEEFYKGYVQLQPSLATIDGDLNKGKGKIMVFDGQHKAAAQLYARRDKLFVRIFVGYDKNRLKETNYRAHTKLAQVHFPQLINDRVGSDLFSEEYQLFLTKADTDKECEDSFFRRHLDKSQRKEYISYFQNYLRYEVLTGKAGAEDNKILSFTETVTSKAKRYPLSYETLKRTLLQNMLFLRPAREPISESEKLRKLERENLIRLMNLFVDNILANGRFNLNIGIYRLEERLADSPESIPDSHLRAYRICRQAAMSIWTGGLKTAITTLLNTRRKYLDREWPENRPLWAEIAPSDWDQIRKMVCAIRDHKVWGERANPDIVSALGSTKQKDWKEILLKGTLPGRQEECLPKLDHNFIFNSVQRTA